MVYYLSLIMPLQRCITWAHVFLWPPEGENEDMENVESSKEDGWKQFECELGIFFFFFFLIKGSWEGFILGKTACVSVLFSLF